MIRLQNVSKYYYKKGIIANGISKVSMELKIGEFVVITGESGSGKSTLLNVISGLDSYEEGEMYIDGKETSHFTQDDFELYRKNYIGNIFQNFNLVAGYTVYQNIELALLAEGKESDKIKVQINEIIDRVGLAEYANTKASKLSGGQKQRVAIARALAKASPIIVADEPTGNLDVKSAAEIVKLLSELAKDRLVVVVTHNFEQFEKYATRQIKMSDGRLIEDRKADVNETVISENIEEKSDKSVSGGEVRNREVGDILSKSKLKLGTRNTFNLIGKFVLLLVVFVFLLEGVASQYASFKASDNTAENMGTNNFFLSSSDERIIVKNKDNSPITDKQYNDLLKKEGVDFVVKQDLALDTMIYIEGKEDNLSGFPGDLSFSSDELVAGRMPKADDEVVFEINRGRSARGKNLKQYLNGTWTYTSDDRTKTKPIKIVGIKYYDSNNSMKWESTVHMRPTFLEEIKSENIQNNSTVYAVLDKKEIAIPNSIVSSQKVPRGKMYVPEDFDGMFKNGRAVGNKLNLNIKNIYFKDNTELEITNTITSKNFKNLLGTSDTFDSVSHNIYINQDDYNKLYKRPDYQMSVYAKDVQKVDLLVKSLKADGYEVVDLKHAKTMMFDTAILKIVQVPFTFIGLIAVFFICYFVIKLILKSRSSYFSTLRVLGIDKNDINRILDIELLIISHIAFILCGIFTALVLNGVIVIDTISDTFKHLGIFDYVALYVIVIAMTLLISKRFAKAVFKKTAVGNFREEV
ncbi:MAG: ABC transporter ATP-binding protein [Eubacteriales bacterium]|nr:ABC transporter ATP-binding protein [Eubacteriales bacterium]MDY3333178.1 ABC transporter ATP-binding protein [Gallibacter sp.]